MTDLREKYTLIVTDKLAMMQSVLLAFDNLNDCCVGILKNLLFDK